MAVVYKNVQGMPGSKVSRTLPNGNVKHSRANQLERVIALHEDVQRRLIKEGKAIFQRAEFRMTAAQARRVMLLTEAVAEANKVGDPLLIARAQDALDYYSENKTKVNWSQADVDFHISLYRPDGLEFHVEVDNEGGRGGLNILKQSLTH